MSDDAAQRLFRAFVDSDPSGAIEVIEAARAAGYEQSQLFDQLFAPAMALLGGAWASGDIDEYGFTQAAVVAEQITSFVTTSSAAQDTGVSVLVGTMHRDTHTIDKDITAATLKEAGHRVIDLGCDVLPSVFLERVEETGARIVIVFAHQVATAIDVVRVREMLTAGGRDDVVLLVSGGPFAASVELARRVGANGVVRGAQGALRMVEQAAKKAGLR